MKLSEMERVKARSARKALNEHDWNFSKAAEALGMSAPGLRKMARRLGVIVAKQETVTRWVKA